MACNLEMFMLWLYDRGDMYLWLDNVAMVETKDHCRLTPHTQVKDAVFESFSWGFTAEGNAYWRGVHEQWHQHLDTIPSGIGIHRQPLFK